MMLKKCLKSMGPLLGVLAQTTALVAVTAASRFVPERRAPSGVGSQPFHLDSWCSDCEARASW